MISTITRAALTRRGMLTGAGAGVFCTLASGSALARAPMATGQAPAYYHFKVGAYQCTAVSDGPLPLGEPSGVFKGMGKGDLARVLIDNFLPPDNIMLEQNALVVNTGDRVILFDTGMGPSTMFGSGTGRLLGNLRHAGIEPKDVDAVVISHAHIDHCNGLMDGSGGRVFPNAQIYINKADYDFWTDEGKLGTPMKDLIAAARTNLVPNRERIVFITDGQEFLPGIMAMHAPGHTVGHMVFMISSQGRTVCNVADLAHHHVLLMDNPRLEFAYDTDSRLAVASRLRILDMLAASRTPLLAYHLPWPGLGHVAKRGDGYRFAASPQQTVL